MALGLLVWFGAAGSLSAQTTWIGSSGGTWITEGNWSDGVPSNDDDKGAVFNFGGNSGTYTVNVGNFPRFASFLQFSVGGGGNVTLSGTGPINIGTGTGINKTGGIIFIINSNIDFTGTAPKSINQASQRLELNGIITSAQDITINARNDTTHLVRFGGSGSNAGITGDVFIESGYVRAGKTSNGVNALGVGDIHVGNTDQSGAFTRLRFTDSSNQAGPGEFIVYNGGGVEILSSGTTQTFSNTFRFEGGSLSVSAVAANAVLTSVSYGTLASTAELPSTISGTGTVTLNGTGETVFDVTSRVTNGADLTISSIIQDGLSDTFTVRGSGVLRLTGATSNTFVAETLIESGRLVLGKTGGAVAIAGDLALAGGAVEWESNSQVASSVQLTLGGGALLLEGNSQSFASIHVDGNSIINFGTAGGNELRFTTGASYAGGTLQITNWDFDSPNLLFEFDPTAWVQDLGTNLIFDGFGSGAVVVNLGGGLWTLGAIPEPGTASLLLFAAAAALLAARRRAR